MCGAGDWTDPARRRDALPQLRSAITEDFTAIIHSTPFGPILRAQDGSGRHHAVTPEWKTAMLFLLVRYPTVMTRSRFLGPVLDDIGGALAVDVAPPDCQRRIDDLFPGAPGDGSVPSLAGSGWQWGMSGEPERRRHRHCDLRRDPDVLRLADLVAVLGPGLFATDLPRCSARHLRWNR